MRREILVLVNKKVKVFSFSALKEIWSFKQTTDFKPVALVFFGLEVIFQFDKIFFPKSYKQSNRKSSNQ